MYCDNIKTFSLNRRVPRVAPGHHPRREPLQPLYNVAWTPPLIFMHAWLMAFHHTLVIFMVLFVGHVCPLAATHYATTLTAKHRAALLPLPGKIISQDFSLTEKYSSDVS